MTTTQELLNSAPPAVTVESLQAELAQVRRDRLEERQRIVEVARRAAADNGLCEVVDRALTRAGLLGGEQVTVKASVPIQLVLYADNGADEASIKAMINEHTAAVSASVVRGLGHVRAVSGGRVRNRDAQITLDGDIQIVSMEQGPPQNGVVQQNVQPGMVTGTNTGGNAWANPPEGYLALYTTPYGRSLHFVAALQANAPGAYLVRAHGVQWTVARTPLCMTTGVRGWQEFSSRQENVGRNFGICTECRQRATRQYRWRGPARD